MEVKTIVSIKLMNVTIPQGTTIEYSFGIGCYQKHGEKFYFDVNKNELTELVD